MNNSSVVSAAPASHPPQQHDQKVEAPSIMAPSAKVSTSARQDGLGNRGIKRKFGKDMTNMFSFNRQPSR